MSDVTVYEREDLVRDWSCSIQTAWDRSIKSFIRVGDQLQQAKRELPHGDFINMIDDMLPFGTRTAQRLMAIAGNPVLLEASHATQLPALPASYSTLAGLAAWPEDHLKYALKHDLVDSETQRVELKSILGRVCDSIDAGHVVELEKKTSAMTFAKRLSRMVQPLTAEFDHLDESEAHAVCARVFDLLLNAPARRHIGSTDEAQEAGQQSTEIHTAGTAASIGPQGGEEADPGPDRGLGDVEDDSAPRATDGPVSA